MKILDQIATVQEMAEKFGVTPRTIRNWCEKGELEARKFNKEWVIVKDQVNPNTIKSAVKIKGLRNAVRDFNAWDKAARIYFDKANMSVETYVYPDLNSWQEFDNPNIVEVFKKHDILDRDLKISMKVLEIACLDTL